MSSFLEDLDFYCTERLSPADDRTYRAQAARQAEMDCQIAQALGVEATFVEGEWDGLLAGLDAGRYDIMINGVDITEERADAYDFSDPYAYNRTAVIVSADNTDITSRKAVSDRAGSDP